MRPTLRQTEQRSGYAQRALNLIVAERQLQRGMNRCGRYLCCFDEVDLGEWSFSEGFLDVRRIRGSVTDDGASGRVGSERGVCGKRLGVYERVTA
jgi:hypothetical protein